MLCRIRWQANDYGTIRWQLMVMQACTPLDAAQRIPGVQPGARLLLHTEGDANVRAVLERIDGIEAQGIAVIDVSPAYWRTLGNRLAARSPLPEYTAERHAAWLAGKGAAADRPTTTPNAPDVAPRPRSRLPASHRRGDTPPRLRCAGLGGFVSPLPRLTYNPSDSVAVGWYRIEPFDPCTASLPRPLSVDSIVLVPLPTRARHAGSTARLSADPRAAAQTCGRGRAATRLHRRRSGTHRRRAGRRRAACRPAGPGAAILPLPPP